MIRTTRSSSVSRLGFTLTADGRTLLEDRATGKYVSLGAFGTENAHAFSPLFDKGN